MIPLDAWLDQHYIDRDEPTIWISIACCLQKPVC